MRLAATCLRLLNRVHQFQIDLHIGLFVFRQGCFYRGSYGSKALLKFARVPSNLTYSFDFWMTIA